MRPYLTKRYNQSSEGYTFKNLEDWVAGEAIGKEEVWDAVDSCPVDKALGNDGYKIKN